MESLDTIGAEQHHSAGDCSSYEADIFQRQLHNLLLKEQNQQGYIKDCSPVMFEYEKFRI